MQSLAYVGHDLSCEASSPSLVIHKNAQFSILYLLVQSFLWGK